MEERQAVVASAAWRYRVGVAGAPDRVAIGELRCRAFGRAREFHWIDDAALRWSAADDAGTVVALCDRDRLPLSTVRGTVFGELGAAEHFLEYSLAGMRIATPTLVMSRAATCPDHARQGLLALVRYACLQAVAQTTIGSVITLVYEGAPRLAMMRDAGYEFIKPRAGWDSEAVAHTQPLLALLPRQRLHHAIDSFGNLLAKDLASVRIDVAAIADGLCAQNQAIRPDVAKTSSPSASRSVTSRSSTLLGKSASRNADT